MTRRPERHPATSDASLILRLRDGDVEAYAELYERHRRAALGLACVLTDQATAEDVVSEAFLKLYQRITAGSGPQSEFRAYLMRTVRTTLIDHQRRGSRVRLVDAIDESTVRGMSTHPPDPDISERVAEQSALATAFGGLPERWRQVLGHLYLEDRDRTEVAQLLGMSPGSVSALSHRARAGLRRAYLSAHLDQAASLECAAMTRRMAGVITGSPERLDQEPVIEREARGAS